ncbi:hypothetical protein ACNQF7_13685 [Flavobacterium sp. RSP29]
MKVITIKASLLTTFIVTSNISFTLITDDVLISDETAIIGLANKF